MASAVVAAAVSGGMVLWFRRMGMGWYKREGPGVLCLADTPAGEEREANIVHELGHRMQDAVPGLVEREREFLEKKTGRRVRSFPRPVAALLGLSWFLKQAVLRQAGRHSGESHGFYHPYAAFDRLDGKNYEVFTMGLQGLLYGAHDPKTMVLDPGLKPRQDHREFVERALREL